MSTSFQLISKDPNQIFAIDSDKLRSDLQTVKTEDLKSLFETLANKEWLQTLSPNQHTGLTVKILGVLPPDVPDKVVSCFKKAVLEFKPLLPEEDILKMVFRDNRTYYLEKAKKDYCERYDVTEVDERQLLLFILYTNIDRENGELVEEILKEDLPLDTKIKGYDLFDIGFRFGSPEQCQKIFKVYQSKLDESKFKQLLSEKTEKIIQILYREGQDDNLIFFLKTCETLQLEVPSFIIA